MPFLSARAGRAIRYSRLSNRRKSAAGPLLDTTSNTPARILSHPVHTIYGVMPRGPVLRLHQPLAMHGAANWHGPIEWTEWLQDRSVRVHGIHAPVPIPGSGRIGYGLPVGHKFLGKRRRLAYMCFCERGFNLPQQCCELSTQWYCSCQARGFKLPCRIRILGNMPLIITYWPAMRTV